MTRESVIEKYLVQQVKALGGEVRKVKWIGRRGAPDRYVMIPPGLHDHIWGDFWVELKATGVKPEAHQLREHSRMRAAGVQVYVIDSTAAVDEVLS